MNENWEFLEETITSMKEKIEFIEQSVATQNARGVNASFTRQLRDEARTVSDAFACFELAERTESILKTKAGFESDFTPFEIALLRSCEIEMLPSSSMPEFPHTKVSFGFGIEAISEICDMIFPEVISQQIAEFSSSRVTVMRVGRDTVTYADFSRELSLTSTYEETEAKRNILENFPILQKIQHHRDFFKELGVGGWWCDHKNIVDHRWPFNESIQERVARYESSGKLYAFVKETLRDNGIPLSELYSHPFSSEFCEKMAEDFASRKGYAKRYYNNLMEQQRILEKSKMCYLAKALMPSRSHMADMFTKEGLLTSAKLKSFIEKRKNELNKKRGLKRKFSQFPEEVRKRQRVFCNVCDQYVNAPVWEKHFNTTKHVKNLLKTSDGIVGVGRCERDIKLKDCF